MTRRGTAGEEPGGAGLILRMGVLGTGVDERAGAASTSSSSVEMLWYRINWFGLRPVVFHV